MRDVRCEECGTRLFRAGQRVTAGVYLRVDDGSFQRLRLISGEMLPASLDGHIALYRAAAAPCACERRHHAAGNECESREVSWAYSEPITSAAHPAGRGGPRAAARQAI